MEEANEGFDQRKRKCRGAKERYQGKVSAENRASSSSAEAERDRDRAGERDGREREGEREREVWQDTERQNERAPKGWVDLYLRGCHH